MRRAMLHYAICGLDYVYIQDAPIRRTAHGDVLDTDIELLERGIAAEIVRQGIPIRGAEVIFLRRVLGLSMHRFGKLLSLSGPAILKWERARSKRLEPVNEVSVRSLMAEKLGVELEGKFTVLRGNPETPARLLLKVAA
jgi:DNA-binding transcriptional regulator YiaG